MFQYATNHQKRKAMLTIKNNQDLTPINLAAKLGRKDLFEKMLELRNIVNICSYLLFFTFFFFVYLLGRVCRQRSDVNALSFNKEKAHLWIDLIHIQYIYY